MRHSIATLSAVTLSLQVATAQAHHSWSVDYDTRSSIVVEGVVSEYLGRRPHPSMTLEVQGEDGTVEQWTAEWNGSFMDASGQSYQPDVFGPGETITITGQPHRNEGTNFVRIRSVVRDADGATFESRRRGDGRGDGRGNDRNRRRR